LISNDIFQGRPHHPEAGSGRHGPPETEKAAEADTPSGHNTYSVERVIMSTGKTSRGSTENVSIPKAQADYLRGIAAGLNAQAKFER